LWSNLLWLSGGLLELGKCSFHQLNFSFEPDGRPMMRTGIYGIPAVDSLRFTCYKGKAKSFSFFPIGKPILLPAIFSG
jgi:hypothetical protein